MAQATRGGGMHSGVAGVARVMHVARFSITSRYNKPPLDVPGAPEDEARAEIDRDADAVLGEDVELRTPRGQHGGAPGWKEKDHLTSAMRGACCVRVCVCALCVCV